MINFMGSSRRPAVAGLLVSEESVCFWETLSIIIVVMGRRRQKRKKDMG
jgi:hypothetical protein